ncbi:hypothetical protein PHMEG_00020930 [Phytophthora megakarya]|uniref:Uncharacterized protein n=1 Tax=Phytophthora megakarya TaxID=4795 RepID=A0A225VN56_9STRA|nr:hypothetical protein PHMEG_00020930 [Phytophthora megakarya]
MSGEARMNEELQESVNWTYAKATQRRPKNTQRPAFNDLTRTTVTSENLNLFVEKRVIVRPKRHKSGAEVDGMTNAVGRATVNSYEAAMVDLWKQQAHAHVNSHPKKKTSANGRTLKTAVLIQCSTDTQQLIKFDAWQKFSETISENLLQASAIYSHFCSVTMR